MMQHLTRLTDEKHDDILAALRYLCRLFWGPEPDLCREIQAGDFLSPFFRLGSLPAFRPPDAPERLCRIVAASTGLEALCDRLEASYVRLFVNSRTGIAAPLYESCWLYEKAPLMGAPAALMKARLEGKGLSVSDRISEPPDHISMEIEYLYFLLERGWSEGDAALLQESAELAGGTMAPWVSRLREKLEAEDPFYALAAGLLEGALRFIGGISDNY